MKKIYKWLRKSYNNIISSIAFYPALISTGFLLLSILMLELDFSETGKQIKTQLSWISLRDASTARAILGTVAGGIMSLTVFSFISPDLIKEINWETSEVIINAPVEQVKDSPEYDASKQLSTEYESILKNYYGRFIAHK